ncbi:MAG TPA: O-antigen ligase family protein [Solirubrobacterales bacterium]|nr:O-antigen ligase family protein [Solirubrobacterales bacterium]
MHPSTMRSGAAQEYVRRVDWSTVAYCALGFGLVVYLGLEGGGYDPLVHDPVGIAIWWLLLAGVAVGALPRRRLPVLACVGLGLLAAFVVWTALSLSWTESAERTWADIARVAGYLGAFSLAVLGASSETARRMVGAVAAGVALVALVALLSRLHPAWFPTSHETAQFLSTGRERLSYPLNYWNGLAGLIAIGAPLLLQIATCAKSILVRALAAAALPAIALTAFFTLSRGGIAATFVALAIFLAFVPDRLPKLLAALLAAGGGAVLVVAASHRDALQQGLLNGTAHQQGNEMLLLTAIVCLVVGLAQAGLSAALLGSRRPGWTVVSRHRSMALTAVAALVVLIAAVAFNAPGRASDGWAEFKRGEGPGKGAERFGSVAGESRYQFWSSAVNENASKPLTGTGSGTFEYWWTRNATVPENVRDTHSLYLQTFGELGIVGLLILVAFLAVVLVGGGRRVLRTGRPELAAALAGCAAFCLAAVIDWMWQIPVLAVAFLLLSAVLVSVDERGGEEGGAGVRLPLRIAGVLIALVAIAAIAVPFASTSLVRQSENDARSGDLPAALSAARSAQNAQPDAASPRLQEALVLESQGDLRAAAAAADAATERESTNWRTWLVLSRIQAELGDASAAVRDYRRARTLNPFSELFQHRR